MYISSLWNLYVSPRCSGPLKASDDSNETWSDEDTGKWRSEGGESQSLETSPRRRGVCSERSALPRVRSVHISMRSAGSQE